MNALAQVEGEVIDAAPTQQHQAPAISQPQQLSQSLNPASPDSLLALAVQRGASLEQLEKFMALKERHDAMEARKAYTEDMALAKKNPPTIVKDKTVAYEGARGGFTSYKHATLGNVVQQIVAWLAAYRFSHSWDTKQLDGGRIAVTCTLTHAMGHSESVTLDASRDDSGSKNNIQAVGSAITYLQRYTLLAITGLATEDQDDDGQGSADPAPKKEQTPGAQQEESGRATWPEESFATQYARWTKAVEQGLKTVADIEAMATAKGALTADQANRIKQLAAKAPKKEA